MIQRDHIQTPTKITSTISTTGTLRQNRTLQGATLPERNTDFFASLFRRKPTTVSMPIEVESSNNVLQSAIPWNATSALLFGSVIIVGLAGTSETPTGDPVLGAALGTVTNVIDAALPTSSTDLVAVALGEAIAGTIGAVVTAALRSLSSNDRKPLVAEALSESDYFIVQASLLPTLQAVGVSPILATVGSVFVASVPSQLVKFNSKQKQRLIAEEKSLLKLLEQEQQRQQDRNLLFETASEIRRIRPAVEDRVDPASLKPITNSTVDFVEIFSDVTRWLGYGVLSDYGDLITWGENPVAPGISGAVLGLIAAFSSTLYADVLYGVFHFGPESKQQEVRERRTREWIAHYASASISGATLFGVYEQSQGPVSRWIQGTLAGGVDGCLGSDSFQTCFDTFIQENAPGPTPEAQVRALFTNLVMVGHRLQDIASDTSSDDVQRLLRAWAVSANSYFNSQSYFPFYH